MIGDRLVIANLYAGIGGNRKLWGDEHFVIAVEKDPRIAYAYRKHFPKDLVIVGDCIEFIEHNHQIIDLVWASPPCITHSSLNNSRKTQGFSHFPDLTGLYGYNLYLEDCVKYKGKYIIENVEIQKYHRNLIPPSIEIGRHYFWTNFSISDKAVKEIVEKVDEKKPYSEIRDDPTAMAKEYGYALEDLPSNLRKITLRNCVIPEVGLFLFNQAVKVIQKGEQEKKGLTRFWEGLKP